VLGYQVLKGAAVTLGLLEVPSVPRRAGLSLTTLVEAAHAAGPQLQGIH